MSKVKKINPNEIPRSPFDMISKEWMLVTAEKDGKVNTMTASWGGVGFLWGKNVAFVFIRPQRYTKTFVDNSDTLSLSFYDEKYREKLNYCGKVSGRDEEKVPNTGFTVAHEGDTPYFEEANLTIICKKLYRQSMDPNCFIDNEIDSKWYPSKDYHDVYVVEIKDILVKED
ncbi:MAG: flavin reductase family protein [Clostridioides sp.]|jgi:flavin reductase (DIM6/NTAB) family NADH-FMN oxidoreductase RutF|nr:flavin reductase family protein [Clostridioides sp.]